MDNGREMVDILHPYTPSDIEGSQELQGDGDDDEKQSSTFAMGISAPTSMTTSTVEFTTESDGSSRSGSNATKTSRLGCAAVVAQLEGCAATSLFPKCYISAVWFPILQLRLQSGQRHYAKQAKKKQLPSNALTTLIP